MVSDKNGGKFTKLKIKNYKCFHSDFAGFDEIKPINIIIGRNNSGKSSLIDMLDFVNLYQNNGKNTIDFSPESTFNLYLRFNEDRLRIRFPDQLRDVYTWQRWGQNILDKPIDIIIQKTDNGLNAKSYDSNFAYNKHG